jgi:hypothetical protein
MLAKYESLKIGDDLISLPYDGRPSDRCPLTWLMTDYITLLFYSAPPVWKLSRTKKKFPRVWDLQTNDIY